MKAFRPAQARLRLANQAHARTKTGSTGQKKAARRTGRIHARSTALRKALLHSLTTDLAKQHASVVVEDLNTAGMLANKKLAHAVSDAAFGKFRRQLGYKTGRYRTELMIADRWSPPRRPAPAAEPSRST